MLRLNHYTSMQILLVKLTTLAFRVSFVLFGLALTAIPAVTQEAVGDWTGLLAGQLHIIVYITKSTDGLYNGTLESPDQGAFVLPVTNIEITPTQLAFSIPKIGGSYEGTWDTGTKTWIGTWQRGQSVPFNLARLDTKASNPLKPKPISR